MILYNLKKNKNEKMPNAYGKCYAYPVVTQTIGIDGLADHISSHNTPSGGDDTDMGGTSSGGDEY